MCNLYTYTMSADEMRGLMSHYQVGDVIDIFIRIRDQVQAGLRPTATLAHGNVPARMPISVAHPSPEVHILRHEKPAHAVVSKA
jgi:hypothetical protein